MIPPAATAAALAAIAMAGAAVGWTVNGWRLTDQVRACAQSASVREMALLRASVQAQTEARQRLLRQTNAADAAVAAALDAAHTAAVRQEHTRHDLARLTTGRACLSADAVRVLGPSPADVSAAGLRLPTPAQGLAIPAATASAHPADQPWASDVDIADWISAVTAQYQAAQARIDALRGWDAQTFAPTATP